MTSRLYVSKTISRKGELKKSGMKEKMIVLMVAGLLFCWVLAYTQNTDEGNGLPLADTLYTEISANDSLLTADSVKIDSVFYSADTLHYSEVTEKILLSGNASIKYHSSNIKSDTIAIDISGKQAFAKGESMMKDGTQLILGENVFYDLDTQWGLLSQGASKFDKGYYYGDEIRKIAKRAFDIDNGIFTTCDALHPHFYIGTKKLRVYHNDKVVGKPIIFYVNHFPVMAFPFGTFTIKRGRQSGILVPSPGWDEVRGKYLENIAYYYAYKNYADATLAFDYFEKTGWELSLHSQYIKRYIFNGNFDAILQKRISGPQHYTYEWNIKSKHHHDFGNNTTFDANLNFVSSSVVWEASTDPTERLAEKITSSMAYKKPFLSSMLNIRANYNHDLLGDDKQYVIDGDTLKMHVEKKDITLPYISYSLPSKPFYELFLTEDDEIPEDAWWKSFSYSYNFKAAQGGYTQHPDATFGEIIWNNFEDDDGITFINKHNAGIKHSGSVKYSYKMKGWLNLTQSVSGNEAWFDRDKNDKQWVRGSDYSANTSSSFSLYGLRKLTTPYLAAVRHIATPTLNFYYQPDFSDNEKYYSFEGIGLKYSGKQRRIGFSLDNKWQLKLRKTETLEERKINDFFTIRSGISYDFESEGNGFSNISHSLDLNPKKITFGMFEINTSPSGSIDQETYELKFKDWNHKKWDYAVSNWTANITSKLVISDDADFVDYFPLPENRFESSGFMTEDTLSVEDEQIITTIKELDDLNRESKNWSISFTHTYKTNKAQYDINDYSSDIRTSASVKLTKNWSVSYDNYINLQEHRMISHSFTITRNLHCWQVYFKYTKQEDYWNYRFQLFNIKLPDALKFRTSDHKR